MDIKILENLLQVTIYRRNLRNRNHQCGTISANLLGLNTSISDFLKTRLMISDRDQQIRMLFLTQHVELTSHGCVRQEIAIVQQNSHCYQNARATRDNTCENKKPYLTEYAVRHEITRVETTDIVLLRVRAETRDRMCQNTTRTAPENADNTTARVKDQRCETARLCRQHDR